MDKLQKSNIKFYTLKLIFRLLRKAFKEFQYFIIDKVTRLFKVKKFLSQEYISLNLGCGSNLKKDFINIDLSKNSDLRLDLRKSLPFNHNSIDFILAERLFFYFGYFDSMIFYCLNDYYRILKKGGKIRISFSDINKFLKAYVDENLEFLESVINIEKLIPQPIEISSPIDYINYLFDQFGGVKYIYDWDKIKLILKHVGFKNIKKVSYDPEYDMAGRENFTLYIIAEKD